MSRGEPVTNPTEARERAAVMWWLGVNRSHLKPHDLERVFDRILRERGSELRECIADYDAHLDAHKRNGIGLDTTEAPISSPVPPPKLVEIPKKPIGRNPARENAHSLRVAPEAPPNPVIEPGPSSPPSNAAPAPEPAPPEQNGETPRAVWSEPMIVRHAIAQLVGKTAPEPEGAPAPDWKLPRGALRELCQVVDRMLAELKRLPESHQRLAMDLINRHMELE